MARINPKQGYVRIENCAVSTPLLKEQAGSLFRSTAGAVVFTLPNSSVDADVVQARFWVEDGRQVGTQVTVGVGDTLYRGGAPVTTPLAIAAGETVEVVCVAAGAWQIVGESAMLWLTKSAIYTANPGEGIFADTSLGGWTLTLPLTPAVGDTVGVSDSAGTFDTNNLTIGRNGSLIHGAAEDMTVNVKDASFLLIYTGATTGWKIDTFLAQGVWDATTGNMEVWFSTLGSDDTGDGTQLNPYATYDKARSMIPKNIDHDVIVKYTAGTYTTTKYQDTLTCGRTGQFILECADPPTVVEGPFTLTGVTMIGVDPASWCGMELTVAAAGWDVDEFYRKFVHVLDGDCQDWYYPIYSNTADTILLGGGYDLTPAIADTFEIVEPAGIIETAQGITFTWNGHAGRTCAQFGIANTAFRVTVDMSLMYSPFIWDGNGNTAMGVVEFYGNNALSILEQSAGSINLWWLRDASGMTDPTLLDLGFWSLQLNGLATVPGGGDNTGIVSISDHLNPGWGASLNWFACRQGITLETPRSYLEAFAASCVYLDHNSMGWLNNCILPSLITYGIRCDDLSTLWIDNGWIESSTQDGILLTDLSRFQAYNVSGTVANIARYGVYVGKLCQIDHVSGCDLEGVSGHIRLSQSDTTVDWPGAKVCQTDSMGSFVTG